MKIDPHSPFGGDPLIYLRLMPIVVTFTAGSLLGAIFTLYLGHVLAFSVFLAIGILGVSFLIAIFDARWLHISARIFGGLIGATCILFFTHNVFYSLDIFPRDSSVSSDWNLLFILAIGVFSIWYACCGRFPGSKRTGLTSRRMQPDKRPGNSRTP